MKTREQIAEELINFKLYKYNQIIPELAIDLADYILQSNKEAHDEAFFKVYTSGISEKESSDHAKEIIADIKCKSQNEFERDLYKIIGFSLEETPRENIVRIKRQAQIECLEELKKVEVCDREYDTEKCTHVGCSSSLLRLCQKLAELKGQYK